MENKDARPDHHKTFKRPSLSFTQWRSLTPEQRAAYKRQVDNLMDELKQEKRDKRKRRHGY